MSKQQQQQQQQQQQKPPQKTENKSYYILEPECKFQISCLAKMLERKLK